MLRGGGLKAYCISLLSLLSSPLLASPRLASPLLSSPLLSSPRLASPLLSYHILSYPILLLSSRCRAGGEKPPPSLQRQLFSWYRKRETVNSGTGFSWLAALYHPLLSHVIYTHTHTHTHTHTIHH